MAAASSVIAKNDPAEAARWAFSITDQNTRNQSITRIVEEWKKTDRIAAISFVQTATILPQVVRQKLLK